MRFIPKHYGTGAAYDDTDFGGDVNASVDFRYTQDPRLHWYFDHHRSAFQGGGDLDHFRADTTGLKFHDAVAPSCARLIAQIGIQRYGFDPSPFVELLRWADIIDTARFSSPTLAVSMSEPALQLAAFVQANGDETTATRLIESLLRHPIDQVVRQPFVARVVEGRAKQHEANVRLVTSRSRIDREAVVLYDLLDDAPRVLNHFIPYDLHPECRYVVGGYVGADHDLKLMVGFNPWQRPELREHNIADLCERFGGGGHAHVGGCTFPAQHKSRLRQILSEIVCELAGLPTEPRASSSNPR